MIRKFDARAEIACESGNITPRIFSSEIGRNVPDLPAGKIIFENQRNRTEKLPCSKSFRGFSKIICPVGWSFGNVPADL